MLRVTALGILLNIRSWRAVKILERRGVVDDNIWCLHTMVTLHPETILVISNLGIKEVLIPFQVIALQSHIMTTGSNLKIGAAVN